MAGNGSVCPDVGTVRSSQRLCLNLKPEDQELYRVPQGAAMSEYIENHAEVLRQEQVAPIPHCGYFQESSPPTGWVAPGLSFHI